jgi:hypothetical protein
MLCGFAPFSSQITQEVCYKVINHDKFLIFPPGNKISKDAKDLIKKLLSDSDKRIGKKGVEEIKQHPFFNGVNWNKIKEMKPPFIPKVKSEFDCRYFEKFDIEEDFYPDPQEVYDTIRDPIFMGYYYKGEEKNPENLVEIIELIREKSEPPIMYSERSTTLESYKGNFTAKNHNRNIHFIKLDKETKKKMYKINVNDLKNKDLIFNNDINNKINNNNNNKINNNNSEESKEKNNNETENNKIEIMDINNILKFNKDGYMYFNCAYCNDNITTKLKSREQALLLNQQNFQCKNCKGINYISICPKCKHIQLLKRFVSEGELIKC